MKKIILSISAIFLFIGAFAQEKEIDAALKAYESKNNAAAKAELNKVAGQINSNTISPETLAKYYYVSGQIALAEGNTSLAAQNFNELSKNETGSVFSVKNKSTKLTEYYPTQAEADAAASKGDYSKSKEETLNMSYLPLVQQGINPIIQKVYTEANAAFEANKTEDAANKFLDLHNLMKVMGNTDQIFKYNAGLSFQKGKNYQKAFEVYNELLNDGYTGENTSYVGTANDGKEVSFSTKADADVQMKLGLVKNVKEVKTPSVEKQLYLQALNTLLELKKFDPIVETASAKYPNDSDVQRLVGEIYHASGNDDDYLKKLIETTKIDPNNHVLFYNIGILYTNKNQDAEAIQYLEKAIQINPSFKNAYTQIAYIKIKPEKEYVEIMNSNLGNSANEKKLYQENTKKRKELYISIIPYLEKAFELDKTDLESATTLRKAYQAAEMFDKEDQMRAIEKSLQAK